MEQAKKTELQNQVLALAIKTSLNVKMNFELYSYRVISPDTFIQELSEAFKDFQDAHLASRSFTEANNTEE